MEAPQSKKSPKDFRILGIKIEVRVAPTEFPANGAGGEGQTGKSYDSCTSEYMTLIVHSAIL